MIDDDWSALADDKLGHTAGTLWGQISARVMALKPTSPIQEKLWSRILANVDTISDYRMIRLVKALMKHPVYVYVVIFGFLIAMACFGPYRPQPLLVILLTLFSSLVGLLLFLILTLSDPFQGDIGVRPATFEYLIETLRPADM